MSDQHIPSSFLSKDIILTFRKQFPTSTFILTNGSTHIAGIRAKVVYQSKHLQIVRVEKSNFVPSASQLSKRCLQCYESVLKLQNMSTDQRANRMAISLQQQFIGMSTCVILSELPMVWTSLQTNMYYEIITKEEKCVFLFA